MMSYLLQVWDREPVRCVQLLQTALVAVAVFARLSTEQRGALVAVAGALMEVARAKVAPWTPEGEPLTKEAVQ